MENSNFYFMIWYRTIYLMSSMKKGFSSKKIKRLLGLKGYEPLWAMVHKIRDAMGQRDDLYILEGMIEADEGYFPVQASNAELKKQKAGRGSKAKSNIMVLAESTVVEDLDIGKTDRHCRYFKAKVLESHKAEGTDETLVDSIDDEEAIVFSDNSTSNLNLEDYVYIHITEKSSERTIKETLKWVHIAIGNGKRDLQKFHKVKRKYLQLYLNEFIYKLNRRYFGDRIFDRLIIVAITGAGS